MKTTSLDALNVGLEMLNQPRAAKFHILCCGKCGNEFDARCHKTCPECLNDSGAQLGLSMLKDFGTKLPKSETTCLACGSTSSDELASQAESDRRYAAALASDLRARGEVYSASLVERMQRQIDDRNKEIIRLRDELGKLQASLDIDEPVISAFAEVESMLKDEMHFDADVTDGVAAVILRREFPDPQIVFVDIASSLAAVPLSLEWEHEFLCDGGFNRHVAAVIVFRLMKTGPVPRGFLLSPEVGMTRLYYTVEMHQ